MAREGDLVLVHVEDKPAFFARIECIGPDVKPDWYQVTLLVLQVPVVQVTWILRQEYIEGGTFTMGGRQVQIERVVAPSTKPPPDQEGEGTEVDTKEFVGKGEGGKVISLFDKK
jgi:hypothetical protein